MAGAWLGPSSAFSHFHFFCMLILLLFQHFSQDIKGQPSGIIVLHLDCVQYLLDGEAKSFFGRGNIG